MSDYWLYGTVVGFIVYACLATGAWTYFKYKVLSDERKYLADVGDIVKVRHPDRDEVVEVKIKGRFYLGRNLYFGNVNDSREEITFTDYHIVFSDKKK